MKVCGTGEAVCLISAALPTVVGDLTVPSISLSIVSFSTELALRSNQHLPSGGAYLFLFYLSYHKTGT